MSNAVSNLSTIDLELVTGGKGGAQMAETPKPKHDAVKQRIKLNRPKTFENNFNLTKIAR
ncbi:MAG: hypothetical protein AB7P03_21535 [Kofleriaceae bacterium]